MKTKWGVWGSGGIARRRTIPEGIAKAGNAEVTQVYCRTEDVNREVATTFGASACSSESELLASDCDVIYIATPVDLHVEEVTRCAESGKHVFCEKPLGRTVEEAQDIVTVCGSHGVKLGVGLMMRFHTQHLEALRMVTAGRIGTPVLGRAQLSCWYPPIEGAWRQDPARGGGGSLMDMGSHCIDLLEMYSGRTRRVWCGIDRRVHDYPSEDTAIVTLQFETGAKGIVDVLFNVPDASSRNRLELYGSRGSILAEGTIGQGEAGEMVAHLEEGGGEYDAQQSRDTSGGIRITPDPVNMYRAEVEAFAQAVLEDTDPPVDGEAGLWNQRVVAAAYESAETGKAVAV
jgi:predicted dehydrogenase